MLEAALQALSTFLSPLNIGLLALGVVLGILIGALPGLGGVVGFSILLPFVWGLSPTTALLLLIGMFSAVRTGDSIPAVLWSIPGTAGCAPTIIDGYAMAKKGEPARALGAAFFASMIGGLFSALILTLSFPIARPLLNLLGSPEFFMLTLLGLTMIGAMSGSKPLKGIVAGLFGMALAMIGGTPKVPIFRYTFDIPYLNGGIPLIVLALGLFALPEIADLLIRGTSISEVPRLGRGLFQGVRDVIRNMFLVLRCSALGTYIGFLPGLGSSQAAWMAYGHVVQSARDKRGFGKGDIRGIIGPESANNAADGGAIMPTLLFGIPGSPSMAVFLAALMILGINPGLQMLSTNLDIAFTIAYGFALGNVLAAAICFGLSGFFARIVSVRVHYWAPFIWMVVVLGAFQETRDWGDMIGLLVFALLGWFMKQTAWPRPPLLVGFVLAPIAEQYLWISVARYGAAWLLHPGVIVIGLFTVYSLYLAIRPRAVKRTAEGDKI